MSGIAPSKAGSKTPEVQINGIINIRHTPYDITYSARRAVMYKLLAEERKYLTGHIISGEDSKRDRWNTQCNKPGEGRLDRHWTEGRKSGRTLDRRKSGRTLDRRKGELMDTGQKEGRVDGHWTEGRVDGHWTEGRVEGHWTEGRKSGQTLDRRKEDGQTIIDFLIKNNAKCKCVQNYNVRKITIRF